MLRDIITGVTTEPPYEFLETLRESEGDVLWDEALQAWFVLSFDLTKALFRDESVFAFPYTSMRGGDLLRKVRSSTPRPTQLLTGPKQVAIHRWWQFELLSPRLVERYRAEIIDPIVERLLDRFEAHGRLEIVDEFCERLPITVFCELMGLDNLTPEEVDRIKDLNAAHAGFTGALNTMRYENDRPADADMELFRRAAEASNELDGILRPAVRARRKNPTGDFLSMLSEGRPDIFEDYNEADTLDLGKRLIFAGSETTTHALANMFYMLLTEPALMDELRDADHAKTYRFIDEVLRLNGSVQFRPRRAVKDVTLGGKEIRAGDLVYGHLMASNRDPKHFVCPHAVDLERRNAGHMSFISGPRTCPGQHLARAELASALAGALRRYASIEFDPAKEPPRSVGKQQRSFRPIWVKLRKKH